MWNHAKNSKNQFKRPISLFSLCVVESSLLKSPIFDENSRNKNAFSQCLPLVWPKHTMRKLTSRAFQKCGSFRVLKVLNQSYWLSKSGENWRKKSIERRRQKKKHGHNIDFWAPKRIACPSHMVGTTCYSFQASKVKVVGVLFFFDASYFRGRGSFFGLIHLWRPITPVQNLTRPKSTTFSESSGREV